MTKTRELTDFERGMIVGLHKGNHTATDIEKILKLPRTTCERSQTVSNVSRSGRPPLLKAIDKRHFIRTAVANRKNAAEEITEKFNSLGLVRHVLHEQGYFSRI